MDAKELRIGNFVYAFKTTYVIDETDFQVEKISTYKPIPITEEWLLKFGFSKSDDDFFEISIINNHEVKCELWTRIQFGLKLRMSTFEIDTEYQTDVIFYKVKSVHQLQNLYFAITGEEIKLN